MKGSCFCKSIRYELLSQPEDVYYCHCRDCRIQSGSAFHVLGIVRRENVMTLAGAPTRFTHSTASGYEMTRSFCGDCGTPLFLESTRFPDIVMFTVSSLEESDRVEPRFQIWTAHRVSWSEIGREIASYPRGALDDPA